MTNSTKNSWVTFYSKECDKYLRKNDGNNRMFPTSRHVYNAFRKAREISGIHLTPQRLREFFCEQMGILGVNDRYIDAFCGRVPNSILARRYTDYSASKLKAIYDRADLRVLA